MGPGQNRKIRAGEEIDATAWSYGHRACFTFDKTCQRLEAAALIALPQGSARALSLIHI